MVSRGENKKKKKRKATLGLFIFYQVLPSHPEWENHVCRKHSLSRDDARNGLMILEEAEVVLQIPQPSRLDTLVTMIKDSLDETPDESLVEW